jgi:hypothetical protein
MLLIAVRDVGLSGRQNKGEAAGVDEESFKSRIEGGMSKKNNSLQQLPQGGARHPERF